MSGGSYDYLVFKLEDEEDIFSWSALAQLERMADDVAALGYADDLAREMTELVVRIRRARITLSTRGKMLAPVAKAFEWWKSADWSEEKFRDELEKWRAT